jgi:hypothetical protein
MIIRISDVFQYLFLIHQINPNPITINPKCSLHNKIVKQESSRMRKFFLSIANKAEAIKGTAKDIGWKSHAAEFNKKGFTK